jgi:hypothetical protein
MGRKKSFVSDSQNNRVLIYPDPFVACGGMLPCVRQAPTVLVAGAARCNAGPNTVCGPEQLAIDARSGLG